jgi:hypothetical protein
MSVPKEYHRLDKCGTRMSAISVIKVRTYRAQVSIPATDLPAEPSHLAEEWLARMLREILAGR